MDGVAKTAAAAMGVVVSLLSLEYAFLSRRARTRIERDRARLTAEKLELERALAAARASAEQWARHAEHGNRLSLLGTTVAQVAHEINNPLVFVVLNLPRVRQLLPAPGEHLSAAVHADILATLGDVEEGAARIQNLAAELKAYSGRDTVSRSRVDLSEIVRASLRLLGGTISAQARVFQEHEPSPVVTASRVRLVQVVTNLVRNALEAAAPGAPCTIRLSTGTTPGGGAFLRVEDDGRGIPDDLQPRIFEHFFTTRSQHGGTGLGLSICRDIVRELQGTIEVRSRPGQTLFEILLPAEPLYPGTPPRGLSTAANSP
jgi:two-component system NtrC family sensor kinase